MNPSLELKISFVTRTDAPALEAEDRSTKLILSVRENVARFKVLFYLGVEF